MDFVSVDVETANADIASICQIGLVSFEGGHLKQSWQTLVNPEDYFDPFNVSIHGINKQGVRGAPTFPEIYGEVRSWMKTSVVASHTVFDRVAIERVVEKYRLEPVKCVWLDTARVARRAWPQFARKGYGLSNMATYLGISYMPHNAEEDARAAGELLIRAMQETGMAVHEWCERVRQPIGMGGPGSAVITVEGNPEGSLYGENVVFTGALAIPRRLAAKIAADAGCRVTDSVTESTTLLIVGDQDIRHLAGHEKSSKHRKAEALMSRGIAIRILTESDFRCLVGIDALE
jgi:DNA polymerase III subunit epsilon